MNSNIKSRVSDKTSTMEKVTAMGFVGVAFSAVFLVMHRDDILAGRLVEVVASYFT